VEGQKGGEGAGDEQPHHQYSLSPCLAQTLLAIMHHRPAQGPRVYECVAGQQLLGVGGRSPLLLEVLQHQERQVCILHGVGAAAGTAAARLGHQEVLVSSTSALQAATAALQLRRKPGGPTLLHANAAPGQQSGPLLLDRQ
jgi:hypothetical protein